MSASSNNLNFRPGSAVVSLLLLGGIFSLNFFSRIFVSPLLPEFERTLHLSHGQAGLFFFFISCGYFLALVGSGFISARIGHKRAIILSMIGIGLSLGLLSLTNILPILRFSFFLLGLFAGLYLPSAVTTISSLFQPHQWGRAFAVHELAPNLAFLTAPLYVAAMLPHLSRQQIIQLPIILIIFSAGLYAIFGSDTQKKTAPPDLKLYRDLFGRREFWLMVLLFSLGITGTLGIYSILPTYLVSEHGFSEQGANLLVGASRLPTLATALAGGFLADRFGNRQVIRLVLLCTGGATVLLGTGGELLKFYVWLQPVIAVCFFPAAFALLSHLGSVETRSVTVSLTIPFAFVLGGGIVPAAITWLADYGKFETAIILTGCLLASGGLLVHGMGKKPSLAKSIK